jgi:4-hydroxy-2-oxoheptanedioate aldolase
VSDTVHRPFRERLHAQEALLGSFINLDSSLTAEIMGMAGFDWIVIDLEHGAGNEHIMMGQLQALASSGTVTLVRVESITPARILHALDAGADGVLVPRLRTAEEAEACVTYCRYAGGRGVARYNRSWQWGVARRSLSDVDAQIVCAVQIETREALEAVDEIAATDGVDVLFVGPSDLAHALDMDCPPDDPRLLDRVQAVAAAARTHRKAAGVLVGTVSQLLPYRALGFSFLGCGSDSSFLAQTTQGLVREMREQTAGPSTAGDRAG